MKNNESVATEVLHLLKQHYKHAIKRLFILLIISIVLFVTSIVDSIYQRCRIINVLGQYEEMMDRALDVVEKEIEFEHNIGE